MVPNNRKTETIGDELLVGIEEGENSFRHKGSRLSTAEKTRNYYDREEMRQQKLAMYKNRKTTLRAKPKPKPKPPQVAAVPVVQPKRSLKSFAILGIVIMVIVIIMVSIKNQSHLKEKHVPKVTCKELGCLEEVFISGLCKEHFHKQQEAIRDQDASFF